MHYRVLIADDHLLVRVGIKALLSHLDHFEVVAEAGDGHSALEMLHQQRPDIALIDISMPGISGIEVALQARRISPRTKIIFLSALNTPEVIQAALAARASGYLLKDFMLSELEQALNMVIRGDTYLSPRLSYTSIDEPEGSAENASYPHLTKRQIEVLRSIALGASTKEMARDLGISPKTVEFHRTQLMKRLGLRNTAGLTLYAARHGLLPTSQ